MGLANSLRGMGTGAQQSVWKKLIRLSFPVILITGELDEKFNNIAKQMQKQLQDSKHIVVPGCGTFNSCGKS